MAYAVFREVQDYIGFNARDWALLESMRSRVEGAFDAIINHFYETIRQHPGASAILRDDDQVARLKGSLRTWLVTLFGGDYGEPYYRDRARIGRIHVRVGLPQHYMFAAMELVRQDLEAVIRRELPAPVDDHLSAVDKVLTLDLAIMLETYKETYIEMVRHSERTEMEERLTQAEHLARIGRLAAALAHEIKNPLAGISGAIQVIREGLRPDDGRRPVLSEVLRQIERLDRTVKDLLVYARPTPPRFERCDVSLLIGRVLALLAEEPESRRIKLAQLPGSPLPSIELDAHQIEQVLLNLLLNAAHASPDGARVSIAASADGDFVQLEVEDHGHGMDEETCRRATEAFFTTKAKGTGLGLSICARIVNRHHGSLNIRSMPGKGTSVRVRLPISQPAEDRSVAR